MSAPDGAISIDSPLDVPPVRPDDDLYGYVPTRWICIVFIVLFALSTLIHFGQTVYSRLWWLFPTIVLAGIAETIGWSGRLWSSSHPTLLDPFLMQISTTIIAPTPLIAANFVILGQIIKRLGQQYSRLSAMWYTIVFCVCDVIALIIQAVGGAQASTAVEDNKDPSPGGRIMLGGIAFQLTAVCVYLILAAEFLVRYAYDKPFQRKPNAPKKNNALNCSTKLMIAGLALDGLFVFIRSVYRTIELQDGWGGRIIGTQVYFNVLDGAMIVLAMFTLNVFHPGHLLGKANTWSLAAASPATRPYARSKAGSDLQLPDMNSIGSSKKGDYATFEHSV